ncbi:MAG: aspartate--tRNA(Asn) ligase, partial [Methanobacteriota archaeon]
MEPTSTISDVIEPTFRSHTIERAKKEESGKRVKIAGWIETIRELGKIKFIILRDFSGKVQCVLKGELLSPNIGKEYVVSLEGTVKETPQAPYGGKEIVANSLEVLGAVEKSLPVDPTSKTPAELETRLNFRFLDLRRDEIKRVFLAKSEAVRAFRDYARDEGFVEIHPPSIIGAASEGGAEVFEVKYFESKAYLAQSPQLYKQMAVVGGLERVTMTGPVFRAEKHNTSAHLNETIQMDMEAAFIDDVGAIKLLTGAMEAITEKLSHYEEVNALKDIPVVEYEDAIK